MTFSHAPPLCLSSRMFMKSSPICGRLPTPPAHIWALLSSLPFMVGQPMGIWTFPRWSVRLWCTYASKTWPHGETTRNSRPNPESWRQLWLPKLLVLWGRPPLPCMPQPIWRYIRPRHNFSPSLMRELQTVIDFATNPQRSGSSSACRRGRPPVASTPALSRPKSNEHRRAPSFPQEEGTACFSGSP